MPFHFQPGCDCKLCGSDTHATARCPRRPEFQARAHATCLQTWNAIVANPANNEHLLIRSNTKWLTGSQIELIRGYLRFSWVPTCKTMADKKTAVQAIYSYLAKRLAGIPLNMDVHTATAFSVYDWSINRFSEVAPEMTCEMTRAAAVEFECPVCYETFDKGVKTNCDHQFCGPCMTQFIQKTSGELPCPMCRTSLSKFTTSCKNICTSISALI